MLPQLPYFQISNPRSQITWPHVLDWAGTHGDHDLACMEPGPWRLPNPACMGLGLGPEMRPGADLAYAGLGLRHVVIIYVWLTGLELRPGLGPNFACGSKAIHWIAPVC